MPMKKNPLEKVFKNEAGRDDAVPRWEPASLPSPEVAKHDLTITGSFCHYRKPNLSAAGMDAEFSIWHDSLGRPGWWPVDVT